MEYSAHQNHKTESHPREDTDKTLGAILLKILFRTEPCAPSSALRHKVCASIVTLALLARSWHLRVSQQDRRFFCHSGEEFSGSMNVGWSTQRRPHQNSLLGQDTIFSKTRTKFSVPTPARISNRTELSAPPSAEKKKFDKYLVRCLPGPRKWHPWKKKKKEARSYFHREVCA